MKTIYLLTITFLLFSFKVEENNFKLDIAKSKIVWTGYAEAGNYAPEGEIKLDNGNFNMSKTSIISGDFEFDMKTISQENKDLEKHLKNEDFFDVEKFPKAFFKIDKMDNNQVTGILTIKGIAKPITFPIIITQNNKTIRIQATMKIDRTQFEIKYNSSSYFQDLGSYAIKNNFDIKLDLIAEKQE